MFQHYLRYLFLFFFVLFSLPALAEKTDFKQYVTEIEQRLDRAGNLYQEEKTDEARQTVQMAYFELFENLEGPIRINFSAKKSYQMEATFGKIRKMMGKNAPLAEVMNKIHI